MKSTSLLLAVFVLLGHFSDVLLSNPDSMVVQDKSADDEANVKRSEDVSSIYRQSRSEGVIDKYSGTRVVKLFRPSIAGSRIVWKEVGRFRERQRIKTPLLVWTDLDNDQPPSSAGGDSANSNTPQNPQNKFPMVAVDETDSNPPSVSDVNKEASYGVAYNVQTEEDKNVPAQNSDESFPEPGAFNSGYVPSNRGTSAGNGRGRVPQQYPPPTGDVPPPNAPGFGRDGSGTNNDGRRFSPAPNFQPRTSVGVQPQNVPGSAATTPNKRVSADSNFFAGIVNNFAFKLVERMNLETNFVISPLSIYIALAMCYLGSDGSTKAQMEEALGMNENSIHGEHLHQGIRDLSSLITPNSQEYQLFVANGMFLGRDFRPEPQFVQDIRKFYNAELANIDFGSPQSSQPTINNWVARSTRNMITRLLSSPPSPLTRLMLLNAVYFKGTWKVQFPRNFTRGGRFRLLDGTEKEVQTMRLNDEYFPYYRSEEHGHAFLKLPYEGDQISMILALPFDESLEPMPSATNQVLCFVRDAMANTSLNLVALPKFRLEYDVELSRPLQRLRIRDLFSANSANMRNLRRQNDVYVAEVLHKSVVDVNEEGTTAAAVTSVKLVPLSYKNNTNFIALHPFAFYIVHEPTGLVLFYGKIFDPSELSSPAQQNGWGETTRDRQRPNSNIRGSPIYRT